MNEITTNELGISIKEGSITFKNFEMLKENAKKTASDIKKIEVSEESIKNVKKELAEVRKEIDKLETGRKQVKKAILEPYNDFESQVKELVEIVNEADAYVRTQVKELEEKERSEKEEKIKELWEKRNKQYDIDWLSAQMFITPQHLNKNISMKKIEDEMIIWFEKIDKDIDVLKAMDNSDDLIIEYSYDLNLTMAIDRVNKKNKRAEKVMPVSNQNTETLISINEKDTTTVIKLLQENEIKFEIK